MEVRNGYSERASRARAQGHSLHVPAGSATRQKEPQSLISARGPSLPASTPSCSLNNQLSAGAEPGRTFDCGITSPQMMRRHSLVSLLLLAAVLGRASATYCALEPPAVCSVEGIEYSNECIARVQGVEIAYVGFCDGAGEESSSEESSSEGSSDSNGTSTGSRMSGAFSGVAGHNGGSNSDSSNEESSSEESSTDGAVGGPTDTGVYINRALRKTEGRVSYDTILAYNSVGYRFIGQYNTPAPILPPALPPQLPNILPQLPPPQDDPGANSDLPRGVGLDRNGFHYVQAPNLPPRNFGLYTPPRIPALPFKRRALLADSFQIGIIGSDDRTRVSAKNRFPYSAVVDVVFNANGVTSGCTASFIGPDILLTSAHCLFKDGIDKFFYDFKTYSFIRSNGQPLGANVVTALVTTQFVDGLPQYDVGLIQLDKSFQDELGYLGHGYVCDKPSLDLTLLGYPVEKPDHALYSSTCSVKPSDCSDLILDHTCDDGLGMSGSPMITPDNSVRAVLLGAAADGKVNTAVSLTKPIIGFIDEAIATFKDSKA